TSRLQAVALAAMHRRQVDACEDQVQCVAVDADGSAGSAIGPSGPARGAVGLWPLEASLFEALVPDRQAVAVEVENLDAVAPPIAEDEPRARARVAQTRAFDQSEQAIEALAHVREASVQIDRRGANIQHHDTP